MQSQSFSDGGDRFAMATHKWKIRDFAKLLKFTEKAQEKQHFSHNFLVKTPRDNSTHNCYEEDDCDTRTLEFYLGLAWNHRVEVEDDDIAVVDESGPDKEFIGLFLHLEDSSSDCCYDSPYHRNDPFTVSYTFKILYPDGKEFHAESPMIDRIRETSPSGIVNMVKKENLLKEPGLLDPDGSLIISCDLEVYTACSIKTFRPRRADLTSLGLGEQLMTAGDKDVKLVAVAKPRESEPGPSNRDEQQKEEVWCHKIVLTARSEVFRAMFANSGFLEGQQNTVNITDVDFKTLLEFVEFLYTDSCQTLRELRANHDSSGMRSFHIKRLTRLMDVAEKYNVESLKYVCENRLIDLMDLEEAMEDLVKLAEMYNCQFLEKALVEFLVGNLNQALKQDWFDNLSDALKLKIFGQMRQKEKEDSMKSS